MLAFYQRIDVSAEGLIACRPPLGSDLVKVLNGSKPADIAAEQSTTVALSVNLKTAKTLDDQVIE